MKARFLLFSILALITPFFITVPAYADQAALFKVHSSSFMNNKDIASLYTCDGRELSPQLVWSGAPAKTVAYVLICSDPDAPKGVWYHWVLYNIPKSVSEIPQGAGQIPGATLGENSWGRAQYNGPCPPSHSSHRYYFTLYALDSSLPLSSGADAATVMKAMQGHVLGKTTIMGIFGH